jgi:transcription elongation factor GreA
MTDLTPEGLEKLKQELEYLKTTKRKEMAERLKQAIAFGDLSENFAYHDAKEAQGFLEGRIIELQRIIKSARIIRKNDRSDCVALGCNIVVEIDGEKSKFEIVGPNEADPSKGRLSNQSPLGACLCGKKPGQSGVFEINGNKMKFKVLSIN